MTLLFIATLENPSNFYDHSDNRIDFERVTELLMEIETRYNKSLSDFIQNLLQHSTEKRPNFAELNHQLSANREQMKNLQFGSVKNIIIIF